MSIPMNQKPNENLRDDHQQHRLGTRGLEMRTLGLHILVIAILVIVGVCSTMCHVIIFIRLDLMIYFSVKVLCWVLYVGQILKKYSNILLAALSSRYSKKMMGFLCDVLRGPRNKCSSLRPLLLGDQHTHKYRRPSTKLGEPFPKHAPNQTLWMARPT